MKANIITSLTYEHILTTTEMQLLWYELSPEYIKKQLNYLQESLNKIFKNFMRLSKYICSKNDNNRNKLDQLKKVVEEIQKYENEYINYKLLADKLLALNNALLDKKSSLAIVLQFKNEAHYEDFKRILVKRKGFLDQSKDNTEQLERLIEKTNNVMEKITLSNITLQDF